MIFSYGFLDSATTEAREMCLNIDMPEDDPLSFAKKIFCQQNRGIRITSQGSEEQRFTWESPLVWIACVNEEDGLNFGLAQTTDGGRELDTTWKGQKIQSPDHLRELLAADPLWDIIQLRAAVLLLERLETQLSLLQQMEEVIANLRENEVALTSFFRPEIFELISRFRVLEADLLEKAVEELIKQVSDLMRPASEAGTLPPPHSPTNHNQRTKLLGSASVAAYFSQQTGVAEEVEDFS
jgi:hypothetical protein